MEKTPMKQAIELLERFNESLDFSKEAKKAVNCSISLIQPLLQLERKMYISLCIGLLDKIAEISEKEEFEKLDEDMFIKYIDDFMSNNIEKQTPSYKDIFRNATPRC